MNSILIILRLLKKLRTHYPTLTITDIIIAGLEELLVQNRRTR